jgi:hypothetical protein
MRVGQVLIPTRVIDRYIADHVKRPFGVTRNEPTPDSLSGFQRCNSACFAGRELPKEPRIGVVEDCQFGPIRSAQLFMLVEPNPILLYVYDVIDFLRWNLPGKTANRQCKVRTLINDRIQ